MAQIAVSSSYETYSSTEHFSIYPIHYSFQVGKFLSFKVVVLDRFILWMQISLLKARRDSALASIVPGLSPPFNGLKKVDGFDDFGRVFLTISLKCGPIMVPAESQAVINKDSVGSSTVFSQSLLGALLEIKLLLGQVVSSILFMSGRK